MISPKVEASRIRFALRRCKAKGFDVYKPEELVKKALDEFGDNLAVSCSFGSCSVVVLHMARDANPHIKVVFDDTGVEYPETYAYRDLLVKEWDLNYVETKPIKSFWKCVKDYGFPLIRQTGRSKFKKPQCCTYLKEKPFEKWCKANCVHATLTGLRASESGVRMLAISQVGQFYFAKRPKIWKFHPIAFWNHKQVWEYFSKNEIPMNEVYTKYGLSRCGCMPCTGFLHWEKQLSRTNLKLYRYIQKLRNVPLLDDFIQFEDEIYEESCSGMLLEVENHE